MYSKKKIVLHVLLLEQKEKKKQGFAVVEDKIITEFKEKPIIKLQLSECLGIYMLKKKLLKK